jgi:hypothetical protein
MHLPEFLRPQRTHHRRCLSDRYIPFFTTRMDSLIFFCCSCCIYVFLVTTTEPCRARSYPCFTRALFMTLYSRVTQRNVTYLLLCVSSRMSVWFSSTRCVQPPPPREECSGLPDSLDLASISSRLPLSVSHLQSHLHRTVLPPSLSRFRRSDFSNRRVLLVTHICAAPNSSTETKRVRPSLLVRRLLYLTFRTTYTLITPA